MKFAFDFKNKRFNLEVKVCKNVFQKSSGLMFRKISKPLLFVYDNLVHEPIHSFFCIPFIIIWFKGNKIIGAKLVKPWRLSVVPKEKFDKFLEIPENNKNFEKFRLLIEK